VRLLLSLAASVRAKTAYSGWLDLTAINQNNALAMVASPTASTPLETEFPTKLTRSIDDS
jgi:hypothetical protein